MIDTTYSNVAIHGVSLVTINKNGCTDTLTRWIYVGMLDIESDESESFVLITDANSVSINTASAKAQFVEVYSISGQLFTKKEFVGGHSKISLPNGQYILRITDKDSVQISEAQKFVIIGG